ncbi:MAG: acyl-CoA dehydrogenase family protein [Planctomycetes bacterium]|nr:acyl-CoA dehydrogenase family protein [Planctomycetota bacterium]
MITDTQTTNFDLTEDQQQIQKTAREFAREQVAPRAQELDEKAEFPQDIFKGLAELGFLGLSIPEDIGGSGFDTLSYILVVEELSKVCGSTGLGYAAHVSLGVTPINLFGTQAQREKYVPQLCKGVDDNGNLTLGCFGLTEPGAGSDAGGTKTRAERKNDHWLVNGRKAWITNPHYAKTCIFTAKTNQNPKDGKGITAFIAELDTPGFKVEAKENKLGMRSSDTAQLVFEDMKLPLDAVAGGEAQVDVGFTKFMKTLAGGRISIGALALGIAEGAYEKALEYARQRKQFNKPIGTFQGVAFMLADMHMEIEAAKHLIYHAARLRDAGRDFALAGSMGKLYASEVAMKTCTNAIQVLGGVGYTREYDVERMMRDAKLCEIGEGTSEVQRLVISRQILGDLRGV